MKSPTRARAALAVLALVTLTGTATLSGSGLVAATAAESLGTSPPLDWAVRAGGGDSDYATDVAISPDGTATVAGTFSGVATFGTGAEALTLSSAGRTDVFLARYDAEGKLQWALREGGTGNDFGRAVAVDTAGGVTVTGMFYGPVTFGNDADAITFTSEVSGDMFLARYDEQGSLDWVTSATGGAESWEIASAPDGGTAVTGRYIGTATFGTGPDAVSLTERGGQDVFVARYGPDGSVDWAVGAGGASFDTGNGIAVAADGAVAVTGSFNSTATFGDGTDATTLDASPWPDAFVARYGADGSLTWVVQAGFGGDATGYAVALSDDAVTVTGEFGRSTRTATFGTASAAPTSSFGYADIFVARYGTDGSLDWVRQAGGTSHDSGLDVAADSDGAATVTGYFFGSATFTGGDGPLTLTGAGWDDAFLARYGPDGSLEWAVRGGGTYQDSGAGVAVGADGAVTVAGRFRSAATFGSGPDGALLRAAGSSAANPDMFLARYRPAATDDTAPTVTITSPADAGAHILNSQVSAGYSCSDESGGSGIATCEGTVPVGDPIDTTTVGGQTFTVTASDAAGNTVTGTSSYDVVYGFSGYAAPLQDGENVVSAGRKLALRFSVFDAQGEPVSTIDDVRPISRVYACESGDQSETIDELVVGSPGLKNFGDGSYQFNFSTSRAWAGSCRSLGLDLGDGLPRTVDFRFR